jgi:hypothetical protein
MAHWAVVFYFGHCHRFLQIVQALLIPEAEVAASSHDDARLAI